MAKTGTPSRTATAQWRRIVRQVRQLGREQDMPCSLCHGARGPIDYRTRAEADRDARDAGQWWLVGAHRPLALSVDHVVPAVAGGADTLENAAPSHAVCNSESQAKGAAQQRRRQPVQRLRPVAGHWRPIDGRGVALRGHDVPGRRTSTHVFVADG